MRSIYTTTGRKQAVEALRSNKTWCVSCGEPVVSENFDRCSACFFKKATAQYCRGCGTELESRRIQAAKMNKGTIRWCTYCSMKMTLPCRKCGVKHPEYMPHDFE